MYCASEWKVAFTLLLKGCCHEGQKSWVCLFSWTLQTTPNPLKKAEVEKTPVANNSPFFLLQVRKQTPLDSIWDVTIDELLSCSFIKKDGGGASKCREHSWKKIYDLLFYRQAVSIQGLCQLPPSPTPTLDQASVGSGMVLFSLHLARKLKPCSLPHVS